jgi:large subunit ribosomal protein L25
MSEKILAEARTEFGKGAARRLRRAGKIPAVVYGGGLAEPIHVTLPTHNTQMAIKHGGTNAVLELEIAGKSQFARTQQVQVDPVRRVLEHVDFVAVNKSDVARIEAENAEAEAAAAAAAEAEDAAIAAAAEAAADRAAEVDGETETSGGALDSSTDNNS